MGLALAGDEELLRLLVASELDGRILFDDPSDGDAGFVLIAACLRFDRERNGGLGIMNVLEDDRMLVRSERVAGVHVFQLRDRADVAGAQLRNRNLLLALNEL